MTKTCKFLCLMTVVLSVTNANALTFKSGEKKSFSDCNDSPNRNYQTKDDILADGKWLDKNSEKSLSKIVRNNLEQQLNFNSRNVDRDDIYPSQKKKIVKPQSSCSNMNMRVTTKIGGVGESRICPTFPDPT